MAANILGDDFLLTEWLARSLNANLVPDQDFSAVALPSSITSG